MLLTDAGTSETPSPAATKLTRVAVSATSWAAVGLKPCGGAGVLDGVVQHRAEVRRVGHERLVLELFQRDRVARSASRCVSGRTASSGSERSTSVQSSRTWTGWAQQSEVERAVEQLCDLRRREQLAAQIEHHAGEFLAQGGGERGEQSVRRGAGEADGEAAVLAAGGTAGVLERGVDGGEDLAAAFEQHLAGGRELDAAGRPVQQRLAEFGLEAADLLREGWLGDVQPRGGAAEVALLGDGDEVAQVSELHGFISRD